MTAAPTGFNVTLAPGHLDAAPPEEQACFGRLIIASGVGTLTGGIDRFTGAYEDGPLVSGYHAAEWFAWNWWRLCHEPRSHAPEWWRSHTLSAIGEGYAWPRITIFSDGARTTLLSDPSVRPDGGSFRYLGAPPTLLPTGSFQAEIDAFLAGTEEQLRGHRAGSANLVRLLAELRAERADAGVAERRRFEALLGFDPDEAPAGEIEALMADAERFGPDDARELAAGRGGGGEGLTGNEVSRIASGGGLAGRSADAARLPPDAVLPDWGDAAPWSIGVCAARLLRRAVGRPSDPIDDAGLAEMAGVGATVLSVVPPTPMAFSLDVADGHTTTALRSRHPAGRRFELARLIGDRLAARNAGRLHPATRAATYRQKVQRSFAAELLCPVEPLTAFLAGDLSVDARMDAAEQFGVSEVTVRSVLVNNHLLERYEADADLAA